MKSPLFLLCFLVFLSPLGAQLIKKPAPELKVDQWVSLPKGQKDGPNLQKDWKGKVIYLYFFQSWCPGCHSSGFPTLQALKKEFADDPGVEFAAVQTVFEGFSTNTVAAAKRIVARYKLQDIPVGQSGTPEKRSAVMRDFKTRGTPWTVVIDQKGKVVFEGFHLKPEPAKKLLMSLLTTQE